jgi:hypothetical protein
MSTDPIFGQDTDLEETGDGQNHRPEKEAQQHHPNFGECFHDSTSLSNSYEAQLAGVFRPGSSSVLGYSGTGKNRPEKEKGPGTAENSRRRPAPL